MNACLPLAPMPDRRAAIAGYRLEDRGYCILRQALAPERITALDDELAPIVAETPFCADDFYGARTKRFGRLLARTPHVAALVEHPLMLALARRVLGTWCDTLQLNLTQAIELHPGAQSQYSHRDQDMWRGPTGCLEYLLNVMWPLTAFSADNGGTLLWPDSHGAKALDPRVPGDPIVAECRLGEPASQVSPSMTGGIIGRATA